MVKFDQRKVAKIFTSHLIRFDYFLVKHDNFLVTFNYSVSNSQVTIRNIQIWQKFSN